jgi:hypothetical protein
VFENKLSNTLSTSDFGWVGTPFLSDRKDLFITDGGGSYGHWSNKEADALIEEAIRILDDNKARELFSQMDKLMVKDAYNFSLFQKPVFLAVYSDFVNVRNNPTSAGTGRIDHNLTDDGPATDAANLSASSPSAAPAWVGTCCAGRSVPTRAGRIAPATLQTHGIGTHAYLPTCNATSPPATSPSSKRSDTCMELTTARRLGLS